MLVVIRRSRNTVGGFILWRHTPTWQATICLNAVKQGALASCKCSDCGGLCKIIPAHVVFSYCVVYSSSCFLINYLIFSGNYDYYFVFTRVSPEIYLRRPVTAGHEWRLDNILKRKAVLINSQFSSNHSLGTDSVQGQISELIILLHLVEYK